MLVRRVDVLYFSIVIHFAVFLTGIWFYSDNCERRDNAVGIATGYCLEDQGSEFESRFLLLHVVQTGSGGHLASYEMGTGGKAAGA
jgi:hypothetical protein